MLPYILTRLVSATKQEQSFKAVLLKLPCELLIGAMVKNMELTEL